MRDGQPRLSKSTISVSEMRGGTDPSAGPYVWIAGRPDVDYRVSDDAAQESVKA